MHPKLSFTTGLIAGLALAASTAFAATQLIPWDSQTLDDANQLFSTRSGLRFTVNPPDPDHPEITVHAVPRPGIKQVLAVANPLPGFPPDPCFRAVLVNPPDPDRPSTVVLHVLQPDQFSIVDATGAPLQLVPADSTTVGTTK